MSREEKKGPLSSSGRLAEKPVPQSASERSSQSTAARLSDSNSNNSSQALPKQPLDLTEPSSRVPIIDVTITASSAEAKHPARDAYDNDLRTFWHSEEEPGPHELLIQFPSSREVIGIEMVIGRWDRLFWENDRVKTIRLQFSDKTERILAFEDRKEMQYREINPPVRTSFVKMKIEEVYPGSRWHHSIIPEIKLYGRRS